MRVLKWKSSGPRRSPHRTNLASLQDAAHHCNSPATNIGFLRNRTDMPSWFGRFHSFAHSLIHSFLRQDAAQDCNALLQTLRSSGTGPICLHSLHDSLIHSFLRQDAPQYCNALLQTLRSTSWFARFTHSLIHSFLPLSGGIFANERLLISLG